MEEAAAGKARLPTVESLTDGTMRRLAAERRVRRPGTSATRVSGPRYRGVKNSVTQHGDLVLYALRYPQPMKANERIIDVIRALQVEDQPCRRVQHRLESAQEVGWDADQHAVPDHITIFDRHPHKPTQLTSMSRTLLLCIAICYTVTESKKCATMTPKLSGLQMRILIDNVWH